MSQLSAHFHRNEFACKCGCGFATVDSELLEVMEAIRQHFGEPITVTSGCRCPSWNSQQGGSDNSWHLDARACDFKVSGVSPKKVYDWCDATWPDSYGLGLYESWVHIDSRGHRARW